MTDQRCAHWCHGILTRFEMLSVDQLEEHYRDSRKDERLGTECSSAAVDLFCGMPHLLTSSVMPDRTKCRALINGNVFSSVVA